MAAGTDFYTRLNIGAVWTGAAGIAKAQSALSGVAKHAKTVGSNLKSMGAGIAKVAGGIAAFTLGYKGLGKMTEFLHESIDEARDAKNVYDKLGISVQKSFEAAAKAGQLPAKYAKMDLTKLAKEQTHALEELAEQMEKTGLSTKVTEAAWEGLAKAGFSPAQIKEMAGGMEDLIIRQKGLTHSAEDGAAVGAQIFKFVKFGSPLAAKSLGLTREQIKEVRKLGSVEARRAKVIEILKKRTYEADRRRGTSADIENRYAIAIENVHKAMGKPFIATQDAFKKSLTAVWEGLIPIVQEFSNAAQPAFLAFAKVIEDNKPAILAFFGSLKNVAVWLTGKLPTLFQQLVTSIQDTNRQFWAAVDAVSGFIDEVTRLWNQAYPNWKADLATSIADTQMQWDGLSAYLKAGFVTSIADTQAQWTAFYAWFKTGLAASIMETEAQWFSLIDWLKTNIIDPIVKLFEGMWEKIKPFIPGMPSSAAPGTPYGMPGGPGGGGAPGGGGGGGGAGPAGYSSTGYGAGQQAYEASTIAAAPTTSAGIAAERAKVMKQLQEPGMRELVASTIMQEQGSSGGRADVLESLVNRAVVTGKHPRQLIEGGGRKGSFYGPYRTGAVQATMARGVPAQALADYDAAASAVAAGRNVIKGRTDQGMSNEVHGAILKSAGEYYGEMGYKGEKETAAWREGAGLQSNIKDIKKNTGANGSTSNTSVAPSPVSVTINGNTDPAEVGKTLRLAMKQRDDDMLARLKSAKDSEARLGYV